MIGKKTFVGYDLGDGETITDLVVLDDTGIKDRVQTLFTDMTMPDSNDPGKAIPTVFGFDEKGKIVFTNTILAAPEVVNNIRINFKRCPSDLLPDISVARKQKILKMLRSGWPDKESCPELFSLKMMEFIESVTLFTNAIFGDENYKKRLRDAASDSEEIVFSVGHPTRWTDLDVAVYSGILHQTILGSGAYVGIPSSLLMAAESRAAFLYVKDKASSRVLQQGTCALLIDVGSSTIDLTAMTADSRNHQYNSGNNYLGARSIDYIIRQWYLNKLKKDEEDWNVYQSLVESNPAIESALALNCRMAKESIYSTSSGLARITFADFKPVRINISDIETMVDETPIAIILKAYANVPDKVVQSMGIKTWKELFREFLMDSKVEMTAQGIKLSRIILTGSASKMPFVTKIVADVFSEINESEILNDMNPSRSISMGLALVGPSNEKSKQFQADLENVMDREISQVIIDDLPKLADSLAEVISAKVNAIVKKRMHQWKASEIKTLDEMTDLIKKDCSKEKLNDLLITDDNYNKAISDWTVNAVGQDIAVKLYSLCEKYGVENITLDQLNALKVPDINLKGLRLDPTSDIANMVSTTIAIIAGVVTAVILPTVLGIVVVLIAWISVSLASLLLAILLAIPGAGWAILLGVAGLAVIRAAANGMDGPKKQLEEKVQKMNLPQWVRNRMSDKKMEDQLNKANMKQQIRDSILEEKSRDQIVEAVTFSLRTQVEKRAEDIKYLIESK